MGYREDRGWVMCARCETEFFKFFSKIKEQISVCKLVVPTSMSMSTTIFQLPKLDLSNL